jgi:hypothetical protein
LWFDGWNPAARIADFTRRPALFVELVATLALWFDGWNPAARIADFTRRPALFVELVATLALWFDGWNPAARIADFTRIPAFFVEFVMGGLLGNLDFFFLAYRGSCPWLQQPSCPLTVSP